MRSRTPQPENLTPQPPLRRGEGEQALRLPLSAPERGLGGEVVPDGLGGEVFPDELWDEVTSGRMGSKVAPDGLAAEGKPPREVPR